METKTNVLKEVTKLLDVKVAEKHDPKEFFQDREGLYIFSGFKNNIISKAEPTEEGKEFKLSSFELTENAYDDKIEASLPEKHIFSETDVCAIVADLISKQPDGGEGVLLNNGYANLFYTPSHVVDVGWSGTDREWSVGAWDRDDYWVAGKRVFSPATEI